MDLICDFLSKTFISAVQLYLHFILSRLSRNPELEDLGTWNPMADDYESKAFNSYKEPTVADFVESFPGYVKNIVFCRFGPS